MLGLKLGKREAKRDARNFRFASIVRAGVQPPAAYDCDQKRPGLPMPMFGNDTYGCCVIAGRAHQTLRFELAEQGRVLKISDTEVINEYLRETEGADDGLIVLDSLGLWRKRGWRAAGRNYRIQAYTEIAGTAADRRRQAETAIWLNLGVGLGLGLPLSAADQVDAGKPWTVASGPRAAAWSWGGHYVYCPAYNRTGPVCVTWGRRQQMTWAFFAKYADEAYAIVDAANAVKAKRFLRLATLARLLANLEE